MSGASEFLNKLESRSDTGTAFLGLATGFFVDMFLAAHGIPTAGITGGPASIYTAAGLVGLKQLVQAGIDRNKNKAGPTEEDTKHKDLLLGMLERCDPSYLVGNPPTKMAAAIGKLSREWSLFKSGATGREEWKKAMQSAMRALDKNGCEEPQQQ